MSIPIFLVRHGEAGMAAKDAERALTERGRAHVEMIAQRFAERFEIGSLKIFASPLVRARETAQIWNQALGQNLQIEIEPMIVPEGNVVRFARMLESQDSALLVVSHFPFVPALASYLISGQKDRVSIAVPTGTVITLTPESEPGRPGSYRLLSIDN